MQSANEFDGFAEIDFERVVGVDAEAELVRQEIFVGKRLADGTAGFVRERVEDAEPDGNHELREFAANAPDDGKQQAGAAG